MPIYLIAETLAPISQFLNIITVFILAVFIGFEVIGKVPSLLHTPLMSGSNAISGISVVGAIMAVGLAQTIPEGTPVKLVVLIFGAVAVGFAMINVVGGFLVTHRMLDKFKARKK